jgi:hypothetical protein
MDDTVFVLGAGASCDFKFPQGIGLVNNIVQALTGKGSGEYKKFRGELVGLFGEETTLRMADALTKSGLISIDRFLEQHRANEEFQQIGYGCIALVINYHEQEHALYDDDQSWYRMLHNKMYDVTNSFQEYVGLPIRFVTFNYDRTLEMYLFNALSNSFPGEVQGLEHFQELINQKIIHAHGSLGTLAELPFNSWYGKDPFDPMKTGPTLSIVGDEAADLGLAKEWITTATDIHFLGFGYDHVNLEKLGIPVDNKANCRLMGTAYGASQIETEQTTTFLNRGAPKTVKLYPDLDCKEYLRQRVGFV